MTVFLCVFMCLQVVNRVGKDAQLGRDGVQRKDWHNYEAIKRDASRSGRSKPPHRYSVNHRWELHNIHHVHKLHSYAKIPHTEERFSHFYRLVSRLNCSSHTHTPYLFLLWVLLLCSSGVNLCFICSSAVINTVYIFYNHHQLSFIFCSGKSASIQTVWISVNGFIPEMSR